MFEGHEWSRNDLSDIGALIEMPPVYENLSARENLKVRTLLLGLHEARNCSSKIQENIFN